MTRESWMDRLRGLTLPARPAIVDGGANKGHVTARLLDVMPLATVLAVEPQPRLARKLAKRFADDARVTVCPVALGEQADRLTLSVLNRPTLSSLLTPTGIRDKYAGEPLAVTEQVAVEVVRLDAATDRADVVKLDLQGYELPALRGASGLLPRVSAVVAETALVPLYAGQALLPELEGFLAGFGLVLEGIYDFYRDPAGRIVSGDAVFVRTGAG